MTTWSCNLMYVFGRPSEKEMDIADKYLGQITHIIDPDNFSMQIGTGM